MNFQFDQERLQNSKIFKMFLAQVKIQEEDAPVLKEIRPTASNLDREEVQPRTDRAEESHLKTKFQPAPRREDRPTARIENEPKQRARPVKPESELKSAESESQCQSLKMQLQRVKIALNQESLARVKAQADNRQLRLKVDQLNSQLLKQRNSKEKQVDEGQYWKAQTESLREEMQHYRLQFERTKQGSIELKQMNGHLANEIAIKDKLLSDMRNKLQQILRENAKVKEEACTLNWDLREAQVTIHNLRQQLKSIQPQRLMRRDTAPQGRKPRGQFQRERFHPPPEVSAQQLKQESGRDAKEVREPPRETARQMKEFPKQVNKVKGRQITQRQEDSRGPKMDRKQAQGLLNKLKYQGTKTPNQNSQQSLQNVQQQTPQKQAERTERPDQARIAVLEEELAQLKGLKARTGAIIRRKCQIERELQSLYAKMS